MITDLINIISKETIENVVGIDFKINPDHVIFKGHFPENPIVPGVLEMQIAETIIQEALLLNIKLHRVSNVKFLNPIYPNASTSYLCDVKYSLLDSFLKCTITLQDHSHVYMNMNCEYKIH